MSAPVVRTPERERIEADLLELSRWADDDRPGWSRVAMTPVETESRHWVAQLMSSAGLDVRHDGIGNVIGTLKGTSGSRKAIVIGSHTDTVDGGGRFDGTVGVIGAIEVARLVVESGIQLRHDLRVVDFYNEEANRFELSCLGSRAIAGSLRPEHLSRTDDEARALGEVLTATGYEPSAIPGCQWSSDDVLGYLELHIEQGPHLERMGAPLGVVTSIAGIARFRTMFEGRRDHAGTMPMSMRQDAGCAAAGLVLGIERICAESADSVGTVGGVTFTPDATSVVTESALVTAEIRSPDPAWFTLANEQIEEIARREGEQRNVAQRTEWLPWERPTPMDPALSALISGSVADLGYPGVTLYSGAGHDAVQMARLGPVGMIFIPSAGGRSHCPEEFSETDHVVTGVHALAQSVLALDREGLG